MFVGCDHLIKLHSESQTKEVGFKVREKEKEKKTQAELMQQKRELNLRVAVKRASFNVLSSNNNRTPKKKLRVVKLSHLPSTSTLTLTSLSSACCDLRQRVVCVCAQIDYLQLEVAFPLQSGCGH